MRRIGTCVMDDWDLPACPCCRGTGEIVMVGRSWISIRCEDCRGAGVVRPEMPPVAVAVITHCGAVLLVRSPDTTWRFPDGTVEAGEDPGAAVVREAAEQAGVTVVVGAVLGERRDPVSDRMTTYFACEVDGGVGEVAGVRWSRLGELSEFFEERLYPPVQAHLEEKLSP